MALEAPHGRGGHSDRDAARAGHKIVPPLSSPLAVARALAALFTTATGIFSLRAHQGDLYPWNRPIGSMGPDVHPDIIMKTQ